ncbi:hypothetical protein [Paraburkholderia acidicola]|nr:hypothetical protein [Paraburkholderia acidicola]
MTTRPEQEIPVAIHPLGPTPGITRHFPRLSHALGIVGVREKERA